ncbi:hypothetical protein [Psychrobacter sp. JCM 18900]|uniref:hypothetical protein n=1 Tax=Psychrobacter sp. JCM 18900 TaxID=1298608 RepID=UPI00351C2DC5
MWGTYTLQKRNYIIFIKKLDPTNSLNPGIGQTEKWKNWQSSPIKEKLNDELHG